MISLDFQYLKLASSTFALRYDEQLYFFSECHKKMDVFQEQGQRFQLQSAFVTGAVFGLFLTIGNTWALFFKSMSETFITWIRPSQTANVLIVDMMTALVTSAICIAFLMILMHTHKCCGRAYRLCPCECVIES